MRLERSDFGFLFAERQAEFLQDGAHQSKRLLCFLGRVAEDDEIIRIPHEIESGVLQSPIETIEHDVRQQRRDDATLRRAACGVDEFAVFHYPGAEKLADNFQNISIGDFFAYGLHDHILGQVIEEPLDVGVNHDMPAILLGLEHKLNGGMASTIRPKAAGMWVELGFKNGFEELSHHFLSDTVPHTGNTEWA